MVIRKASKNRRYGESVIQIHFLRWLAYTYPSIRKVTFSIPNGSRRGLAEGARLVREGMLKGVPDIFVAYPINGKPGIFLEFKSKTGKVSADQKEMIENLRGVGYQVSLCYSWLDGQKAVLEYLGVPVS